MGSLQDLALDDYYLHFTVMVVVLVVLSGILELIISFVTKKVKQMKYRYMEDIVNCVYKELMVLGIVSALLFVGHEMHILNFAIGSEEENDVVVEFVHFMLFLIGVFYIMLVGAALILVIRSSYRAWGKQEDLCEDKLDETPTPLKWYEPLTKLSEFERQKAISYYIIRTEFIEYNNLSPEFDFARYLRKCMRGQIVNMIHINKYMWGILLFIVLCNAARVASEGKMSSEESVILVTFLGWLLLIAYFFIFLYCCHIFWKVLGFNGKPRSEDIKTLFFLRRPQLVLHAIQMATFLHAFYLSLFVLAFASNVTHDAPASISWLVIILTILPPFISVVIFLPQIYPIYVLTCSIHNLSDKKMIEATFKEVIKANRMKSGVFSYAKEWQKEKQWRGSQKVLSTAFDLNESSSSSSSYPLQTFPVAPPSPAASSPPSPSSSSNSSTLDSLSRPLLRYRYDM